MKAWSRELDYDSAGFIFGSVEIHYSGSGTATGFSGGGAEAALNLVVALHCVISNSGMHRHC